MTRHQISPYLPGAIVVAAGLAIAMVASTYPLGTLLRPGPGFFPMVVAVVLSVLGLGVLGETWAARATSSASQAKPDETAQGPFPWRSVLCTCVAVLVFALTVERFGFVPASCLLIAITAFAETERSWIKLGFVALFIAVFGSAVFIWGLGLPIQAFGAS
ncbi:tripartite tricarboxylate transporter TctB family protein [Antarcticimicrobium sediminis]|uniref:Tripartite tricarboxylate transporter TctB family protein n=1 Tax=Antarcticimicrobium sediminis TaxID=2546227 RepID=A0A4R5EVE0_9RHOB|nr:tripartite tricarboxylate transporter TctB family protein [Antarcticimicrobium sediminis]TDE38854.1 tripartite tricarboxylate transporter TctB family protein [Antarcticimicrobium sediminis]